VAKPRYELWGEMVREVGVLLLVFGPLDYLVEYSRSGLNLDVRHWAIISGCALAGIVLMAIGVEIERR
jgi:ABC-type tungstate transport system substrate-binding protein